MPLMHAHTIVFTMRYFYVQANNIVTSLWPLHNRKQDVGNIIVWDKILSI